MRWFAIVAALLAVGGLLVFQLSRPAKPLKTRVTLLGDSNTVLMQQKAPLDAARRDLEMVGLTKHHVTAFGGFTCQNLDMVLMTVAQPPADVVLLMIGSNDLQGNPKPDELNALMNTIRNTWPNARLFVAPVPPSNGPKIPEAKRQAWNKALAGIAAYHHATLVPDLALSPADYESDTVHLSKSGLQKMRDRWLKALSNP